MSSTIALLVGALLIPLVIVLWLLLSGRLVQRVPAHRAHRLLQAGVWMVPAAVVLVVVLIYPLVLSIIDSFRDSSGQGFVGWENWAWLFTDATALSVLKNNLIWVVVFTVLATLAGLVVAIAADRVRYESVAKAIIIVPTAISLTATAVVWQQMFQYRPSGQMQVGTVDGLVELIPGLKSQAWLQNPALSTYAIIIAAVWAHAGIATVILSSAVKSIPVELLEAVKADGANAWQALRHVTLPQLWPTIVVVGTVEVIYALKVFDIVYVMTGGLYGSDVIATQVYRQLFLAQDLGRASVLAVFLAVLVLPVVYFNIRQLKK